MPPNTVKVDRTTKWGNPFALGAVFNPGDPLWPYLKLPAMKKHPGEGMREVRLSPAIAIETYSWWIIEQPQLMLALDELRGKNLACWCKPGEPCHADYLLKLVNS